jgi:hypothetical protein
LFFLIELNLKEMNEMTTPRPVYHDSNILIEAFGVFEDNIEAWCQRNNHTFEDRHRNDALDIFTQYRDGFDIAHHLVRYNWAPDAALVKIFEAAYDYAKSEEWKYVREWAMKEGIRFEPKKGNNIQISHKGQLVNGIVIDILNSEARGWVEVVNTGEVVAVNAEEVVKIVSHGDGRVKKPTPVDPNSGGSPMAMVA